MPLLSVREHRQTTRGKKEKRTEGYTGKLVIYGIFCFISPLNQVRVDLYSTSAGEILTN